MKIGSPLHISEIKLGNVIMNGAYIGSKTLQDVAYLANSASGAVVVGSISVKPRKSNPGQGYWLHKERFYSLNSYGLPNGGIPYFKTKLPLMVNLAHAQQKPLIANLIGFSKEEFVTLITLAQDSGVDMAELNFGCPNVWDGGQQKQIISYHASLVKEMLEHIRKHNPKIPLSVKISPLPPDSLYEVAQAIIASDIVQVVTATNSYPNASPTTGTGGDDGSNEVLAGLAGRALKPISIGVVKQLRDMLPSRIAIIGCGGVSSANDVRDYLAAGAKAVQIATALVDNGAATFDKILYQAARLGL
jgi:dihydroorotate dehydrogenase (fumarate)